MLVCAIIGYELIERQMANKRIVIVEDEPDIAEVLSYNLRREGFDVQVALDGTEGLSLIQQMPPDLVLLDLMLPGMDGLEICLELKKKNQTSQIFVIMLTAKGEESDVVLGLGLGADDYITKPFSPKELVARVKAVLRRGSANQAEHKERIEHDGLLIDASQYKVMMTGCEIKLTASEFRLLFHLASHPGRVFTREQLLNQTLGDDVIVVDRNIDVHIRAIRKKLGEEHQFVETIRGVGYRFREVGL